MSGTLISVMGVFVLCAVYAHWLIGALRDLHGGGGARLRFHIDPFVWFMQRSSVFERIQPILAKPRLSLAALHGGICHRDRLLSWSAECLGLSYIVLGLTCSLGAMSRSGGLILIGALIAVLLPVIRARELLNQANRRRQAIVMELPELLSKLLLMVGAGENVMRALARSVEQKQGSDHPLYAELGAALEGMRRGESLSIALEELGRRCAVPEVRLFATTLLINARRGGEDFVPALRELTRQMWERRKAIARTLGEQASSRLAFPLALVFLLIMILVGAPTMLMM
jgi:tight adherence protein C